MDNAVSSPEEALCERCGRCLRVCPSYQSRGIETFSPRGRLDLIRALECRELTPGPRYRESMETCLQCLACSRACPKGVDSAGEIRDHKARLLRENPGPQSRLERLALTLALSDRRGLYALTAVLSRLQHLLPDRGDAASRHLPLFLPQMLAGRRIPRLSRRPVFSELPPESDPSPGIRVRGSVTLFTGCFFGYAATRPVTAAVTLLLKNGWQVRIPRDQTCCGAPSLLGGYPDIARRTALKNLDALAGTGPVITLCATCGNCLTNDYPDLFPPGSGARIKARDLGSRIQDIHPFLAGQAGLVLGDHPVNRTVTVHDPCHLNRGLGVSRDIRLLLGRVPGLDLCEMDAPDACCGGGGLCALKNPDLSQDLGRSKAQSIITTGATVAAAPCPGCMLQIQDSLSRKRAPITTLHPVELMARSFGPNPDTA